MKRPEVGLSSTSKAIDHGYAVLRMVTNEERGTLSPVGVAAWDTPGGWHILRTIEAGVARPWLTQARRRFLNVARDEILDWAKEEAVPYAGETVRPNESAFWVAARRIMTTAVQVDPPRAMEPLVDPESDVESLFEAVVRPHVDDSQQYSQRVDGAVTRALGSLAHEVRSHFEVDAFGGVRETVMRGNRGRNGWVLVEGVNLASTHAKDEADALVSRMLRIREVHRAPSTIVKMIVAYCASPGGLNGESHLRDWIRHKVTDDVFDVSNERLKLQSSVAKALQETGVQGQLELDDDSRLER